MLVSDMEGVAGNLHALDLSLPPPWQKLEVATHFIQLYFDYCLQESDV